jgi:hypothetical protein
MNQEMKEAFKKMNAVLKLGKQKACKKYGYKKIMIALSMIRRYLNIQIAYARLTEEVRIAA